MAETPRCPRCGAELAKDVAQGLCPKCLLEAGIGPSAQAGAGETQAAPEGPSSGGPAPVRPPREGEIFGDYRLLRALGRGGMGVVYEAEHIESGRHVALKILSQSLDSSETRARFLREGRLAASINHPNSVYIYGTEEIEGTPAIAMELVPGGTLEERIRQHGPMPPAAAVDTILQIIDGLEAAQRVGVLHRDVKPSNCFVEQDGTVKVGDFGLSISTKGRADTIVTMTGAFLGTPAFSSPEQLRGDELDVRSDIYAVGITLYYLLTGQTPFKADNLVRFVATVLERPAPSPAAIRPELPRGLCEVVLRCLEKQPARRYRDYGQLREALLPYASASPTPATLGWRAVAYLIDLGLWMVVTSPLGMMFMGSLFSPEDSGERSSRLLLIAILGAMPLWVLYFAVGEGIWGATVGKAICRLRVVGPEHEPPGVLRALWRAFLFIIVPVVPSWIYFGFNPVEAVRHSTDWGSMLVGYAQFAIIGLYFAISARRRNGFAALHDLASGVRVIGKPAREGRPALEGEGVDRPVAQDAPRVGPYHILGRMEEGGEEFLMGYDPRLLRKVTIRRMAEGSGAVPAAIRGLGRPTRLRWLAGRRTAGENWDAYEAMTGRSLLSLIREPQPWRRVRYWLMDLADELAAGQRDGTAPAALGLDRVWIAADGRAKLLDFPAPGADAAADGAGGPAERPDREGSKAFLRQVAVASLEGRAVGVDEAKERIPAAPLPLHARAMFEAAGRAPDVEAFGAQLRRVVDRPARAGYGRRVGLVIACAILPMLMAGAMLLGHEFMRQIVAQHPDLMGLHVSLIKLEAMERLPRQNQDAKQIEAVRVYIAGRFGKTISDPATWRNPLAGGMDEDLRAKARQLVAEHPAVSKEELAAAAAIAQPLLGDMNIPFMGGKSFVPLIPIQMGVVTLLLAILSIACAAIFRAGLAMLLFGVAVVREDGARAGRLRCVGRALIAWSPCLLGIVAIWSAIVIARGRPGGAPEVAVAVACASTLALFLAIAIVSALLPGRGIPDRAVGTWLVPR